MSKQRDEKPTAASEAHRYRIVPIGSSNQGWAIERDGKITRTGNRLEVLGAQKVPALASFGRRMSSYELNAIKKLPKRQRAALRALRRDAYAKLEPVP